MDFRMQHFTPISHGFDNRPKSWGPGTREIYSLHYVFKGCGYIEIKNQTYPVTEGQSFLVMPGIPIKYYPDTKNPWSYMWLDIAGDESKALFEQTEFSSKNPISPIYSENEVIPLFKGVMNASEHYEAIGKLYILFNFYLINFPSKKTAYNQPSYIQLALNYIKANAHRSISIEDIANHISISRAHLYRIFQKELSIAPGEYLIRYRINNACKMLTNTKFTIKVIAYSLGFESPLYFSRVFRKRMGMSPGQYRKKNSTNQN